MDRRPRAGQGLVVLVAVMLLNASVTFHNVWPTLGVHWPGELSVELAAMLVEVRGFEATQATIQHTQDLRRVMASLKCGRSASGLR